MKIQHTHKPVFPLLMTLFLVITWKNKLASKIELTEFFTLRGWTINPSKVQRLNSTTEFLGIIWSSEGRLIPDQAINQIDCIPTPITKEADQKLIELHIYWKQTYSIQGYIKTHL